MNQELSAMGRRIVDAVIEAPVAWRSPGELATRLGWSLEQTLDEIALLDASGWLEAWELVDGPVVTLSVAATASYGVRLVEVGHDETPRWVRSGDPDPPTLWATGVFRSEQAAALNLVADSRPGAELAAMMAEEAANLAADPANAAAGAVERFPRPTLLIGAGLSPWPGPLQGNGQACPACRLAHLHTQAYCLLCDRWGFDLQVEANQATRPRSRRSEIRFPESKANEQKNESERRKRRYKRKKRRQLQANRLKSGASGSSDRWLLAVPSPGLLS